MEPILKAAMALRLPSSKQIPQDPYSVDSISLHLAAVNCSQPLGAAVVCSIAFDVVKAKGHWSSEAFLIYLKKHAEIMAPYTVTKADDLKVRTMQTSS